jgi:hypothetical protein
MYYCPRCQSRFHSERAASIRDCPRCLLRDDVASPLVPGSPPKRDAPKPAPQAAPAPDPDPAAEPDTPPPLAAGPV